VCAERHPGAATVARSRRWRTARYGAFWMSGRCRAAGRDQLRSISSRSPPATGVPATIRVGGWRAAGLCLAQASLLNHQRKPSAGGCSGVGIRLSELATSGCRDEAAVVPRRVAAYRAGRLGHVVTPACVRSEQHLRYQCVDPASSTPMFSALVTAAAHPDSVRRSALTGQQLRRGHAVAVSSTARAAGTLCRC
jgi:hypothetical protein